MSSPTAGANACIISLRGMVSLMTAALSASVLTICGVSNIIRSPDCGCSCGWQKWSEDLLEPDVARLHPVLHAGFEHRLARRGVRPGHAHAHQGSRSLGLEGRFHAVVRRRVGQVHPLHVNDAAERDELVIFAGEK